MTAVDLESAALFAHFEIAAVTMAFIALAPIASSLVGIGLTKRFDEMSFAKFGCYLLTFGGIVGLINFLFALNAPDLGIQSILLVNTIVLYVQGISLIIIGYGMYSGRKELAEES